MSREPLSMAEPLYKLVPCVRCGALADAVHGKCWLCGAPGSESSRPRGGQGGAKQKSAEQAIRQSTAVVSIVLGAILLGTFLLAPGLGIVVLILAAPILAAFAWRRTDSSVLSGCLAAFGIGVLLVLAVVGAFFVLC